MKPIRKAVRTFLLKNNKVLSIKYTSNDNKLDYYDIPGGGIEYGETSEQAAIREFKEESEIIFDIFIASEYNGNPEKTSENISKWVTIDELLLKEKKFSPIYLLDKNHKTALLNKTNFKFYFVVDKDHKFLKEIEIKNA